ncbi:hypothetical protein COO60DRAFT_1491211 [Scenedesmus sp. NREL 46B-D3]|nr:hypothetical protein COO60DRAFT_1491211 [Scenedesmus sp. NREL 46B-D3]
MFRVFSFKPYSPGVSALQAELPLLLSYLNLIAAAAGKIDLAPSTEEFAAAQPAMSVVLQFRCGITVTADRAALVCASDVLDGALTAAEVRALGKSSQPCMLPLADDDVEHWKLLLPLLQAAAEAAVDNGVAARTSGSSSSSSSACPASLNLKTAAVVLRLADKYNMISVCSIITAFLTSNKVSYTQASCASGDPASIWRWLQLASKLNQPQLLDHYKQHIIAQRLVPGSAADIAGLHPTDLAELLLAFMKENAQSRYRCLGCAGRHCTEVRLCSRCSFSPHIRL